MVRKWIRLRHNFCVRPQILFTLQRKMASKAKIRAIRRLASSIKSIRQPLRKTSRRMRKVKVRVRVCMALILVRARLMGPIFQTYAKSLRAKRPIFLIQRLNAAKNLLKILLSSKRIVTRRSLLLSAVNTVSA